MNANVVFFGPWLAVNEKRNIVPQFSVFADGPLGAGLYWSLPPATHTVELRVNVARAVPIELRILMSPRAKYQLSNR